MLDTLRHRGPDGEGVWKDRMAGIALGQRRLAIIDLSPAGRQPMTSLSGRYVITYNGEIYNFPELRIELEAAGFWFIGHSDTEVLLAAIEHWGLEPALLRCVGMFAFAVWDNQDRTLHLARDRMGKKPLYVARTDDGLVFASELKAINGFPGFRGELDRRAASEMLARGWVPDHECIWRQAFKLAPGGVLSITAGDLAASPDIDDIKARVRRWWSLADVAASGRANLLGGTLDELATELDALLRLCVRQRMVADVQLGAFLSGGIDSSIVVALMQAQSQKPVKTFTIAFGEKGFDESSQARDVAHHLGTEHTELHLSSQAARETIPDLSEIWDEPFADESQIPTLMVSRLARQHVTVALSGDGGDECFGGYRRHFIAPRMARFQALPGFVRAACAAAVNGLAGRTGSQLLGALPMSEDLRHGLRPDRLARLSRLISANGEADMVHRLLSESEPVAAPPGRQPPYRDPDLDDLVSRIIYQDMVGYLRGDVLVKLDRASMAASLEGRCPLLDHRVVEFAWRLPTSAKIGNGQGKLILRNLLGRYIPRHMIDRPKRGFDVPIGTWLRGPLREWGSDLIAGLRATPDDLLDVARIDRIWRSHLAGSADHSGDLWSVLMFQSWRSSAGRPRPAIGAPPRTLELLGD
jgi:asparagine synthase (glutamine-hydrolysing)